MATKQARCTNFGECSRADRKEALQIADGSDPVCPECRSPVVAQPVAGGGHGGTPRWRVPALLGLMVLASVVGWRVLGGARSEPDGSMMREPPPRPGPLLPLPPPAPAPGAALVEPRVDHYDLVLAGSNTIGGVDEDSQKGLATELVTAFLKATWPGGTLVEPDQLLAVPSEDEKDRVITYKLTDGAVKHVLIQPHGSSTVAAALTRDANRADVGMSSTPRHDLPEGFHEFVIALDAVAVIVHPSNPRTEITLAELQSIFGPDPTLREWPEQPGHAIKTYGRDRKSGTTEVFRAITGIDAAMKQKHLDPKGALPYTGIPGEHDRGHLGFENTNAIIERVSRDPDGIGYVGRAANPYPGVKVLAVRAVDRGSAFKPNPQTIRTMEYAMARELYLYRSSDAQPLAKQFTAFCIDERPGRGQDVADTTGFVGFGAGSILEPVHLGDQAPQRLRDAVAGTDRVAFSFRFNFNESSLDTVSEQNLGHLRRFLDARDRGDLARRRLIIVGHADSIGSPGENLEISRRRAEGFKKRLEGEGFYNPIDTLWFGSEYLIADDRGDPKSVGAQRNRRVDVFLVKP